MIASALEHQMSEENWDEYDAMLAESLFGTGHRASVVERVERWLSDRGLPAPRVVGLEMSIGAAISASLADGSSVFVKAWPSAADPAKLNAQLAMQDQLALSGYPAPRLRSALEPMGEGWAVLMDFDQSGEPTDVRQPGVTEAMAAGLAKLVSTADRLPAAPGLPRHELPELWPEPHNVLFDFEATTAGADWIDRIAEEALTRLRTRPGAPVVGHLDWSAKNMRMSGQTIAVVYDWDTLHLADECFVIGAAAASFPTTWELPIDGVASPAQVTSFIAAYERARGALFTVDERERISAAVVYTRAYTARCDHCVDPQGAVQRWSAILAR